MPFSRLAQENDAAHGLAREMAPFLIDIRRE
jgi:hypothetical protein